MLPLRTATQMLHQARLAQPAERKALNLVVVGSSPTVGVLADSQLSAVPPRRRCRRTSACWSELRPCLVADVAPVSAGDSDAPGCTRTSAAWSV